MYDTVNLAGGYAAFLNAMDERRAAKPSRRQGRSRTRTTRQPRRAG
ncbi:hypothetical protein JOE57_002069 [Microlunatus panaciterrae]|uniref:Uncharacterized protein n=1 Tax=Microlunatus panaciterrae TaxID=400768 RepID=A0ABS2RKA1_9ACTN|nr:hypothetical protein [Microlunatus panaciterrae]MBM7799148.1 hypothetical protein [Microlunatus panaciterrae]